MDTKLILNYLTALGANNNREWYHAHKAEYKSANMEFEALIGALIERIGEGRCDGRGDGWSGED